LHDVVLCAEAPQRPVALPRRARGGKWTARSIINIRARMEDAS
jgi:hypothetical protein